MTKQTSPWIQIYGFSSAYDLPDGDGAVGAGSGEGPGVDEEGAGELPLVDMLEEADKLGKLDTY